MKNKKTEKNIKKIVGIEGIFDEKHEIYFGVPIIQAQDENDLCYLNPVRKKKCDKKVIDKLEKYNHLTLFNCSIEISKIKQCIFLVNKTKIKYFEKKEFKKTPWKWGYYKLFNNIKKFNIFANKWIKKEVKKIKEASPEEVENFLELGFILNPHSPLLLAVDVWASRCEEEKEVKKEMAEAALKASPEADKKTFLQQLEQLEM